MTDPGAIRTPNPRVVVGFLAVILLVQGFYAAIEILGDGLDTTEPLRLLAGIAFFAYAAILGVFIVGVWRRMPWAWTLAVVLAGFGLALTGLQILAGDPVEQHVLGVVIDGGLLYYLFKPSIRSLFTA